MEPLVSIIIPVYNQEDLVIKALDSIPRDDRIEIIIVDDGSTDKTPLSCKWWIEHNPNMNCKLIILPENKGLGNAKNVAYASCTGVYIHELDSDDYLYTVQYRRVMDELDGTDIVYIDMLANNEQVFKLTPETRHGYCGGPCRFYRRAFIEGIKVQERRAGEDWFFNEEVLAKNPTEKFTGILAYHYNFPRDGSLYDLMVKGKL